MTTNTPDDARPIIIWDGTPERAMEIIEALGIEEGGGIFPDPQAPLLLTREVIEGLRRP